MINSGYRDAKDQERMRNGGSGSNPAAKLSLHQAGTGVDINGTASPQFQTIKEVMKDNGFKWGGGWKKPDPPHFEINDYDVKGTKAYKDRLGEAARKAEEYFKKCIKG